MIGYEPHSALPVGIPSVFSTPSPCLPKFLAKSQFHSLASGVCFIVPFVRQLYWLLVRQGVSMFVLSLEWPRGS